jgi:hypothetical protein
MWQALQDEELIQYFSRKIWRELAAFQILM